MIVAVAVRLLTSFLSLGFFFPLWGEEIPLFSPPIGWEISTPTTPTPKVKASFSGKTKGFFTPSINLAIEKTSVSFPSYLKAVQKLHEAIPQTRWRNLGFFPSRAGQGILTEIDTKTEAGQIRLFQFMLEKNNTIYLLTAAALKEEFFLHQEEFLSAFRSFHLVCDLLQEIERVDQQLLLQEKTKEILSSSQDSATSLQKFLTQEFSFLGAYWHFLFLSSMSTKKSPLKKSQ